MKKIYVAKQSKAKMMDPGIASNIPHNVASSGTAKQSYSTVFALEEKQ